MKLHRLYLLISITLYNLWTLTQNGKEHPRTHKFKDWLKIEITTLKVPKEHANTFNSHAQKSQKTHPEGGKNPTHHLQLRRVLWQNSTYRRISYQS